MKNIVKKVNCLWKKLNWRYYWGDPLDVRYFLCERLSAIKNKKVLDLACGPGVVMSCLGKSNEVTGVELDERLAKIARELNPEAKIIQADMFSLPIIVKKDCFAPRRLAMTDGSSSLRGAPRATKQSYDAIILANVLPKHDFASEHEPRELIKLAGDLLKPGGKLFLTTPNAANAFYKKRGKFINRDYLIKLFDGGWNYEICGWNPFPIQAGHLLKYVPGILGLLAKIKSGGAGKSVALYLEAVRQASD